MSLRIRGLFSSARMEKVYEHPDFPMVGHFQSILESEGIRTEVRNEGGASLAGEVPFTQVFPELWVLETKDVDRAKRILEEYQEKPSPTVEQFPDWTCPKCGEQVDGGYAECWNCGSPMPTED